LSGASAACILPRSCGTLRLRLQRAGDDLLLVLAHRLKALLGNLRRVVLLGRADLRVIHVGTVEEVRVGWAGHQRGHGHVSVLQFGTQRPDELMPVDHRQPANFVPGHGAQHRAGIVPTSSSAEDLRGRQTCFAADEAGTPR
jgi:hypothetical protein